MTKQNLKITCIIPARFASVRFPGKPLASILGKSMIQRTWENAKRCKSFAQIAIATDDERIFDHVNAFGGLAIMTPESCPTGSDRAAHVVKFHPDFFNSDIVVNIQGDEPLVEPETIQKIINILADDPQAVMSTAAAPIYKEEEALSPSIVKAAISPYGDALYFSRALIPSGKKQGFREGIVYHRHIGIYAFRKDFLLRYGELPPTPLQVAEDLEHLKVLEHGYRIKVAVVPEAHVGVDHPEDIKKIEFMLCNQSSFSSQAGSVPR